MYPWSRSRKRILAFIESAVEDHNLLHEGRIDIDFHSIGGGKRTVVEDDCVIRIGTVLMQTGERTEGTYGILVVDATNEATIESEVIVYSQRTDANTITSTDISIIDWTSDLSTGTMTFNGGVISKCSTGSISLAPFLGLFSWRLYCEVVTDMILNDMMRIGSYAFDQFNALEFVEITGFGIIDRFTFRECGNLSDVSIGEGLTSIDQSVFMDYTSISDFTFPGSVTSLGPYNRIQPQDDD